MKHEVAIMEILEAFDLLGSYRAAANLVGCSPNTVKRFVLARESGIPVSRRVRRGRITDPFTDKIWEMVDRSRGKIQAKKIHQTLVLLGYEGSFRTTCYAVRQAKMRWSAANARVHRPWVASPGQWMQYDFGHGPRISGVASVLFVAWLAWSKARFVMAIPDKTLASVVDGLDQAFRYFGGVPTYVLTDNERTVTSDYVCRLPVRNAQSVSVARWYSTTIHTCMPYDPASKGGVERSVQVAKDDLVPKDTNLRTQYESFADLARACREFNDRVNGEENSSGFIPLQRLAVERESLHKVPSEPYPLCDGQARRVGKKTPIISFDKAKYSVPYTLMGKTVYVRHNQVSGQVVITHRDSEGMIEVVATHAHAASGQVVLDDAHFPPSQPTGPLARSPRACNDIERAFLDIGEGASRFVAGAAGAGVSKLGERLGKIVDIVPIYGKARVEEALSLCAQSGRFTLEDVCSIMQRVPRGQTFTVAGEDTLSQGTSAWAGKAGVGAC